MSRRASRNAITAVNDAPTDTLRRRDPFLAKSRYRRAAPARGPPHQCADQRRAQIREIWAPTLQRLANGAATPIQRSAAWPPRLNITFSDQCCSWLSRASPPLRLERGDTIATCAYGDVRCTFGDWAGLPAAACLAAS